MTSVAWTASQVRQDVPVERVKVPVDDPPSIATEWSFAFHYPWQSSGHFVVEWKAPEGSKNLWPEGELSVLARPMSRSEAIGAVAAFLPHFADETNAPMMNRLDAAQLLVNMGEIMFVASQRHDEVLAQARRVFGEDSTSQQFQIAKKLTDDGWPGDLQSLEETVRATLA